MKVRCANDLAIQRMGHLVHLVVIEVFVRHQDEICCKVIAVPDERVDVDNGAIVEREPVRAVSLVEHLCHVGLHLPGLPSYRANSISQRRL